MPAAYSLKMIIIGDSAVGKTSLLRYFVDGKARTPGQPGPPTTIGVDFMIKKLERLVNGVSEQVQVQVWDTAGQEKFRTITPMTYKSTQGPTGAMKSMGMLVCYDCCNRETFDKDVEFWVNQFREHASDNAVTCLIGNKKDLADAGQRQVQREEGEALAKSLRLDHFYETSAYSGDAVEEMFLKVVDEVLERIIRDEELAEANNPPGTFAPPLTGADLSFQPPAKKPCAC